MSQLITWSRKNKKNGEKLDYVFVIEKNHVEAVRVGSESETVLFVFKIGDEFETYAGKTTVIESFFIGRDDSVYGKGSRAGDGKDISLANQIDILFDNNEALTQHTINKFTQNLLPKE